MHNSAFLVVLAILTAHGAVAQGPAFTTLYTFQGGSDGSMGEMPNGVILGKNGRLYGTTYVGGSNTCASNDTSFRCGTVFELTPATGTPWTKTVLHNFNGTDGALPDANLIIGSNGALYGTTQAGGSANNGGTVFELTPPVTAGGTWTERVLYSFTGIYNTPHTPYGGVIVGPRGALYGTTYANFNWVNSETGGTVFMLTPPASPGGNWTERTIHSFWPISMAVGTNPFAGVIFKGGSLYGTTYFTSPGVGGGCGSVYEVSPPATTGGAWTGTAIHSFGGGDGCSPGAPLTEGPGGVLYGTTFNGGSVGGCRQAGLGGCGVVFQLTPPATPAGTWTETVIYNFTGLNGDGSLPWWAGVVVGKNGVLYGTTLCGGSATTIGVTCSNDAAGSGTVFALTPPATPGGAWSETILHSFTGQGDGAVPAAGLTLSESGVLYGTTSTGGTAGQGTVFSIKP